MCEGCIGDWEASLATAERDGRETRSFLNLLTCMGQRRVKITDEGDFLIETDHLRVGNVNESDE